MLVAEAVRHFLPRAVELHNYSAASATPQKLYNWAALNARVFRRLGFQVSREDQAACAAAAPGAIERLLLQLRARVEACLARGGLVESAVEAPPAGAAPRSAPSGCYAQPQQAGFSGGGSGGGGGGGFPSGGHGPRLATLVEGTAVVAAAAAPMSAPAPGYLPAPLPQQQLPAPGRAGGAGGRSKAAVAAEMVAARDGAITQLQEVVEVM